MMCLLCEVVRIYGNIVFFLVWFGSEFYKVKGFGGGCVEYVVNIDVYFIEEYFEFVYEF